MTSGLFVQRFHFLISGTLSALRQMFFPHEKHHFPSAPCFPFPTSGLFVQKFSGNAFVCISLSQPFSAKVCKCPCGHNLPPAPALFPFLTSGQIVQKFAAGIESHPVRYSRSPTFGLFVQRLIVALCVFPFSTSGLFVQKFAAGIESHSVRYSRSPTSGQIVQKYQDCHLWV